MQYETVPYTQYLEETLSLLADPGLLLVAAGKDGAPPNAMTIGWGTVGVIWGRPMFIVLVRPSRYTYTLLEQSDSFTVCVPSEELYDAVDFCGTRSGRDYDKFQECSLESLPSLRVEAPGIAGAPVVYECQVVHTNDLLPPNLAEDIKEEYYASGDFHRLYFGQVLATRALPDAGALLGA